MSTLLERLKPEPWGRLSIAGRAKRVVAILAALGGAGMAWAATTAESDWNITQADVKKQFG